ncbi:MAG TPA: hypothetical protein VK974_00780 [Methylophilaceae bacterium]|nr:hypothetical protein [Methylophilaceae bacterium]
MANKWKRRIATSHTEALRMCKDFAKEKHNLSIERIADLMGVTADSLYKWLSNGSMPLNRIRSYQMACRCYFVTSYFAHSDGNLLIPVPSGKPLSDDNMLELNSSWASAMNDLSKFYLGEATAEMALASLTKHMEVAGWHRVNIEKHDAPELDFSESELS